MDIYTDYLLKNFGNTNLKGFQCLSYIYNNCDLNNNLCKIYREVEENLSLTGSCERNVRNYIEKIISQIGLENLESILKCKPDKLTKFSNKAFIIAVKLRAENGK